MIQRIQTLYLLLALACISILYLLPFGEILSNSGNGAFDLGIEGCNYIKDGKTEVFSVLPLTITLAISSAITFITIFFYKKRMLQIRFSIFNIIIQLGSIGLMFFFLFNANKAFGTEWTSHITIIMPAIAAIFTYLAIRAIGKDETLVRATSRLR